MGLNKQIIKLIKYYQNTKDHTIGSGRCKHYPSCSNYGIECYEKFNFIKATVLTSWRILRCNPLSKKVYDPVPLSKKEKQELKEKYNSLLYINNLIDEFINIHKDCLPIDYIEYIYNYVFKEDINNDNITLFYELLYVFKNEVKKKNINLDYKIIKKEIDIYLSKPFHKPKEK